MCCVISYYTAVFHIHTVHEFILHYTVLYYIRVHAVAQSYSISWAIQLDAIKLYITMHYNVSSYDALVVVMPCYDMICCNVI